MIQKLNWENRIPVNVLSNNAVRYGIYDSEGNLLRYEYIKKEDEPVVEGTKINKLQGDKIDDNIDELIGERSRVDRYNVPTITTQESEIQTIDIIPKTWTEVDAGIKYSNGDIILTASSYYQYGDNNASKACDGDDTTYWRSANGSGVRYLIIEFPKKYKILKMKTYISGSNSNINSAKIQGSNDGTNWADLYSYSSWQSSLTEVTLTSPDYYKYYRLALNNSGSSVYVQVNEWQVSQWQAMNNILSLDNIIAEYVNNERILIDIKNATIDYDNINNININNLGNKTINNLTSNNKWELVYNGTEFDAHKSCEQLEEEIYQLQQAIIELGGVI